MSSSLKEIQRTTDVQQRMSLPRASNIKDFSNESVDSLINISSVRMCQGNYEEVQSSLKVAIDKDPFDFRPYYNLFVFKWKTNCKKEATANLKKCLSLLYIIKNYDREKIERALLLWSGNSAAHAIKIVGFIKQDKLDQASDAIAEALQYSTQQQHILTIAGTLSSLLTRNNQKTVHNSFKLSSDDLLPLMPFLEEVPEDEQFQMEELTSLISEFNEVNQKLNFSNEYVTYPENPNVLYMRVKNKTTIDLQKYIAENLPPIPTMIMKQDSSGSTSKKQSAFDQPKFISQPQAPKPLPSPVTRSTFELKLLSFSPQNHTTRIDPYIQFAYGCQRYKSAIASPHPTKPFWENEKKIFTQEHNHTIMKMAVFGRQIFKWDEEVGMGEIDIAKEGKYVLPIYYKHRQTGTITFIIIKMKG